MKTAAIYTRVSSDQQKENKTIDSQVDALLEFAKENGYVVPEEYIFKDEGYSGAILVRPGLEKVRDLSAEGQIQAVLVYSPDRLSRNYAYQVVLIDEFHSCGIEVMFVNSPKAETPEEALLLQFQGMIAEYERAMIKERSRRGKRFKAKSGNVSVMSGAPYGYKYIKKTDAAAAYYEINEQEASVVREIYRLYTDDFCSIGAVARALTAKQVPTKKGATIWERSTVWGILRNPAYCGKACFGKTEASPRQKVIKPLRAKGGYSSKNKCTKEKPREEWIELSVPAIVSQATFDIAQERLKSNKLHAQRNTVVLSLVQGMMVCSECGYALYRTATTTSAKNKIYYYRCFGSDDYRFEGGRKCTCKPIRQDYLDRIVWEQIVALLQDPTLIQREVEKRVAETKNTSPLLHQKASFEKQRGKAVQAMDKLLDAYQEGLIPIAQLRKRMPELQKRVNTIEKDLEQLKAHELALDQRLQLLDVASFTNQIDQNLHQLDIKEKKKILRLLVKEIIVGDDLIDIKHSIPLKEAENENNEKSYQLCTKSEKPIAFQHHFK
ncbi:recombinase family protein [Solitalea lacus]|uniref:recombinase family protein n=2 Tax=Solitalea lacus TaxID=2911172 RepID=UPI001EDB6AE5|nr:recombinase family protein [Solitalea lacus]UKJ06125.1 recombinase family protein [Solitalea lacus]